ncbi:DUF2027 domain-containing protein [Dyadobacter sp. CY312]|uniref:Smr/MutS family protein n=1 Tax=Dyadobacter sp. CY312 TaxID=2907303 RepID=UPI001F1C715D|nr:DUF2027 domain-containing protein [Dyadobacter sp. CY312]MCE7040798.1 DUF2027 domain-containing protein [Dyadobacter sp. CY312]
MNIGDKVRLVHGREEGIVYAFLPGNVVEVEIEDGFRIPVLKNEIVTISPVESQRLVKAPDSQKIGSQSDKIVSRTPVFAEKGIYLAFASVNDRAVTVHLINNTDWILPFTATAQDQSVQTGLGAGTLQPRSAQKLSELLIKDFEMWPTFDFKILYYREGRFTLPLPLNKKLKCRAQSFYKSKGQAPVLGREAFVYQLDEENLKKEEVVSEAGLSDALRTSMMGGAEAGKALLEKPGNIVDLHIEKIQSDVNGLNNEAILKIQLATFESSLERAIANGMEEITFIHGSGSGVLRTELHRRLGKNQHVQYYKDAQKEKFGYGATLVKIK